MADGNEMESVLDISGNDSTQNSSTQRPAARLLLTEAGLVFEHLPGESNNNETTTAGGGLPSSSMNSIVNSLGDGDSGELENNTNNNEDENNNESDTAERSNLGLEQLFSSGNPSDIFQRLMSSIVDGDEDGDGIGGMVRRGSSASRNGNSNNSKTYRFITEEEMKQWLTEEASDVRLSQLQKFVSYVLDLCDNSFPPIIHAMRRLGSMFIIRNPRASDFASVLRFGYTTCFKSLVYMEIKGKEFDVEKVVDIVNWQEAYQMVCVLCSVYQLRHNGHMHSLTHALLSKTPTMIVDPFTKTIVSDLKNLAHQRGKWSKSKRFENPSLYGPHLQPNDVILEAMERAKKGNAEWEHLDSRVPNGPMNIEQEQITVILASVAAVDKMFGVERSKEEWSDLRELLTMYGVCDNDADYYHDFDINNAEQRYGMLHLTLFDLLTPIGYNFIKLVSQDGGLLVENNDTKFKKFEHIDPYTIRIVHMDDTEEFLAFCGDVEFARIPDSANLMNISDVGMMIEYENKSEAAGADMKRMDDITMAISKKVLRENRPSEPYNSPRGIQSIAFALMRPWKNWRGISVVEGAVGVAAFSSLQGYIEGIESIRQEQFTKTLWDGLEIDVEVIAIARAIELKPCSNILGAYLSHICTHDRFKWDHVSPSRPHVIGQAGTILIFGEEDAERFIELEKKESEKAIKWKGPVSIQQGQIVVPARRPLDLIVLIFILLVFSLMPAFSRPWNDAISETLQNIGSGMIPIVVLYTLLFYKGWNVQDMWKGQEACVSLDIAAKVCKRTKEEINMLVKSQGLGRQVFKVDSNSVALSGQRGNGNTSCGELNAAKLMDAGAIFLAKLEEDDDNDSDGANGDNGLKLKGMVDVGGFLELEKDKDMHAWSASQGTMEPGVWTVLGRDQIENISIF